MSKDIFEKQHLLEQFRINFLHFEEDLNVLWESVPKMAASFDIYRVAFGFLASIKFSEIPHLRYENSLEIEAVEGVNASSSAIDTVHEDILRIHENLLYHELCNVLFDHFAIKFRICSLSQGNRTFANIFLSEDSLMYKNLMDNGLRINAFDYYLSMDNLYCTSIACQKEVEEVIMSREAIIPRKSIPHLFSSVAQIDFSACSSDQIWNRDLLLSGQQLCQNVKKQSEDVRVEDSSYFKMVFSQCKEKFKRLNVQSGLNINSSLPVSVASLTEVDLLLENIQTFRETIPKSEDSARMTQLINDIASLKQLSYVTVQEQANAISILSEYENIAACLNAWMEQTENELDCMGKSQNEDEQPLLLIISERDTFQPSLDRSTELFHALLASTKLSDEMDQRRFHASLEQQWERIKKTLDNRLKKKKKKHIAVNDLGEILAQAKGNLSEMDNVLTEPIRISSDEQLIVEKRKHIFLKETLNEIHYDLKECSQFKKMPREYGEALGQFKLGFESYEEQVALRITEIDHLINEMRQVNTQIRTIESVVEISQQKIESLQKLTNGDKFNQVIPVLKVVLCDLGASNDLIERIRHNSQTMDNRYESLNLMIDPLIRNKLDDLDHQRKGLVTNLENLIEQIQEDRNVINAHRTLLEDIQGKISATGHQLDLLVQTGDITPETLSQSLDKIKLLREEFQTLETDVNRLKGLTTQVFQSNVVNLSDSIDVNAQMQSLIEAYNEMSKNLYEQEIKFSSGLQLWNNWSELFKNDNTWANAVDEESYHISLSMNLPSSTQNDFHSYDQRIQALRYELSEKEERLQQLKQITTDIVLNASMDEVGQSLLQSQVEHLSHKLMVLKDALSILNARAEVRKKAHQRCHDQIQKSRSNLKDMRHTIESVESESDVDSTASDEQLSQLRNQLLALGRAESELTALNEPIGAAHETSPLPVPSDSQPKLLPQDQQSDLTSILEDWQNVFHDTFVQYHRLSTNLAAHEDISSTVNIWQRYLKHVQSFLQDRIANNMITLTEQQRLGDVHHRILSGHHQLVRSQLDQMQAKEASGEPTNKARKAIVTQLDNLSRSHEEVMKRITDRNVDISERLEKWNKYRYTQESLFEWLERLEKRKITLNLKHVQVEAVPALLEHIQSLLDEIPKGEAFAKDLEAQLKVLLQTAAIKGKKPAPIDEILQKSLQLELHAMKERISSIKASLKTWVDHLTRIRKLEQTFNKTFKEAKEDLRKLKESLNRLENVPDNTESEKQLKKYRSEVQAAQKELETVLPRLSKIADLQDELRECTSPADIKKASHQLWLLRHQHSDLEFHFKTRERKIQEDLDLGPRFEETVEQFNTWAEDLKRRLQDLDEEMATQGSHYLTDYASKIEAGFDSELESQEQQVAWIDATRQRLAKRPKSSDYVNKAKQTQERWLELKKMRASRIAKAEAAKADARKILHDLSALRSWIREVEIKLNRPVHLSNTEDNEYQNKLKEYLDIQKKISNKSPKASEIFNNCDVFLTEPQNAATYDSIKTSYFSLQRRWDQICSKANERQEELEKLWDDWTKFQQDHERLQLWIDGQFKDLRSLETQAVTTPYNELDRLEQHLTDMKDAHQHKNVELDHLNDNYCDLAREYRLDNADDLKTKFIRVNHDWETLGTEIEAMLKRIRHSRKMYQAYMTMREKALNWLRQIDAELTEVEFSSQLSPASKRSSLSRLRQEMKVRNSQLDKVEETSMNLIQKSELKDAEHVEEVAQEFSNLRGDVTSRLNRLCEEYHVIDVPTLTASDEEGLSRGSPAPFAVHESIQVETLKFERDAGVQADTLTSQSVMSGPDSGVSAMSASWPVSPSGERDATPVSDLSPDDAPGLVERFVSEYQEQQLTQTEAIKERAKESTHESLLLDIDRYLNEFDQHLTELQLALTEDEDRVERGEPTKSSDGGAAVTSAPSISALIAPTLMVSSPEGLSSQDLGLLLASCRSTQDLVTHLNNQLMSQHHDQSRVDQVRKLKNKLSELEVRLRNLRTSDSHDNSQTILSDATLVETERVHVVDDDDDGARVDSESKCPLCKRQNWKQLNREMWRLEKWLEMAKATLKSNTSVPRSMEQLEDAIQDHREFLLELDSHKSLIMSINVIGSHLSEHSRDKPKVEKLQERLSSINAAWDNTCEEAMLWRVKLQNSLLQNSEFHRTIDELSKWLEKTTATIRSSEPVDLTVAPELLEAKYQKFLELHGELQRYEPRIVSLQEAAENSDCDEVKQMLSALAQKLRILINVCHVYASRLAKALGKEPMDGASALSEGDLILPTLSDELLHLPGISPPTTSSAASLQPDKPDSTSDSVGMNTGVLSRSYRFLGRVVRAAVPIQAMMLLLLGVSSIVPLDRDELICTLQNNLERSLEPMLRWSEGPPPI
ncbi:muscle-specific protein 300 kDa-like isoform X1 [Tigriopus californicus]|uniref:muscle-specific protein 300 kDa-like isoform X1 n=1 Tax=Tigriopus californicus TaxID=6832 RepID=UPI0027DA81EE|nr:muscle-specific protein 300 kDa-like isoform X1 [Tigriopus californicus]